MAGNILNLLIAVILINSVVFIESCKTITISSRPLGTLKFQQIPLDTPSEKPPSGRASYVAKLDDYKSLYLYHIQTNENGHIGARWVINDILDSTDTAIAFVNSWSVAPHLTKWASNYHDDHWVISEEQEWIEDQSLVVVCTDIHSQSSNNDNIIYFESSDMQPTLTGFYIERVLSTQKEDEPSTVYSLIKTDPRQPVDLNFYLFKLNENTWMIGDKYGEDAGLALVEDDSTAPHLIQNSRWRFTDENSNNSWIFDETAEIYHSDRVGKTDSPLEFLNIYITLRFKRSIQYLPSNQRYITMRNDVPIPQIGLGTGGIPHETFHEVLTAAVHTGYRFLDLARDYNNEHMIAPVLDEIAADAEDDESRISRRDFFLQSKVWPTQLGVLPTLDAIYTTLAELKTSYVDSYLIHWPFCETEVEWFHCEDTVDKTGTWQDSWAMLEKAYSEGLVNSIGISNFDMNLIEELTRDAIVIPHIVQNYAAPGSLDFEVRDWCIENNVVYQPYASGRNIGSMEGEIKEKFEGLAAEKNMTLYKLVHKFFLETGAVTIPRSTNVEHLESNLHGMFDFELTDKEMHRLGWGIDEKFGLEL